jgi:hypothetical protein
MELEEIVVDKVLVISNVICMSLLKIGKAAAMLGVTVQTLRAWEASGELIPDRRSNGGTRYYDAGRIAGLTRQPPPQPTETSRLLDCTKDQESKT